MIKLIIKNDATNKSVTVCQNIEEELDCIYSNGEPDIVLILSFMENLENHVRKLIMDINNDKKDKEVEI